MYAKRYFSIQKLILYRERHAEHPLAGQNTRQVLSFRKVVKEDKSYICALPGCGGGPGGPHCALPGCGGGPGGHIGPFYPKIQNNEYFLISPFM